MRRLFLLGVLAAALASRPPPARAKEAPAVHVSETEPFTVRGLHFQSGERVKIAVRAKGTFTASRTAAADGSFSAVLPGVKFDECTGYVVRAEGSRGSRASLKLRPAECGAPPQAVDGG
jgi:hypothetical protein